MTPERIQELLIFLLKNVNTPEELEKCVQIYGYELDQNFIVGITNVVQKAKEEKNEKIAHFFEQVGQVLSSIIQVSHHAENSSYHLNSEAEINTEDDAIHELLKSDSNVACQRAVANFERAGKTGNNKLILYTAITLGFSSKHCQPYPKLEEAMRAYQIAAEKALIIKNDQTYATVQNYLGNVYADFPGNRDENLQKAITCYKIALTIRTEEKFPQEYAVTQNNLGTAYTDLPTGDRSENLGEAVTCYKNALRVYDKMRLCLNWATTQHNMGAAYAEIPTGNRNANLRKAIACYENALSVRTEQDFPYYYAGTNNNMGNAYQLLATGNRRMNLLKSVACFENALRVYTETGSPQDYAMAQSNLGNTYRQFSTGDRGLNIQKAVTCFENALRIYTEVDFPQDYARTQNNLGNAYRELPTGDRTENLRKAIACFENTLTVYTETDFPQNYARTQNNLGDVYRELPTGDRTENLQKAIAYFENALRVRTEEKFPQDYANTQMNMGNTYLELTGDEHQVNLQKAVECYNKALRFKTEKQFPQDYATLQNNLGVAYTYLQTGDRYSNIRKAVTYFENALQIRTRQDFPQERIQTLFNCASAYDTSVYGKQEKACEFYQEAIHILETEVRAVSSVETRRSVAENSAEIYHRMISLCIRLGRLENSLVYAERGKSRTLLEMIYSAGTKVSESVQTETFSYETINKLIPPDTLFVECFAGYDCTYIFLLDGKSDINNSHIVLKTLDGNMLFTCLIGENWLTPYYEYPENNAEKKRIWFEAVQRMSRLLSEKFWHASDENGRSLSSMIEQSEAKRIVFFPHSGLHLLPLHLIPVQSENGERKRLLDQYEITYAPSISMLQLILNRTEYSENRLFAVADPDRTLTFADSEVRGIETYFDYSHILWHEDAEKQAIISDVVNADILHFSCHGNFRFINPLDTQLVLAGKNLALKDIFGELRIPDANTVVLSACETGMIELEGGDEYIGLPAGFLHAGANTVISSLWAVDDLSTSLLMQRLYKNMLKNKMGKAAALREAQLWVRDMEAGDVREHLEKVIQDTQKIEKHIPFKMRRMRKKFQNMPDHAKPFEHPYYWGAFTCTGNWN